MSNSQKCNKEALGSEVTKKYMQIHIERLKKEEEEEMWISGEELFTEGSSDEDDIARQIKRKNNVQRARVLQKYMLNEYQNEDLEAVHLESIEISNRQECSNTPNKNDEQQLLPSTSSDNVNCTVDLEKSLDVVDTGISWRPKRGSIKLPDDESLSVNCSKDADEPELAVISFKEEKQNLNLLNNYAAIWILDEMLNIMEEKEKEERKKTQELQRKAYKQILNLKKKFGNKSTKISRLGEKFKEMSKVDIGSSSDDSDSDDSTDDNKNKNSLIQVQTNSNDINASSFENKLLILPFTTGEDTKSKTSINNETEQNKQESIRKNNAAKDESFITRNIKLAGDAMGVWSITDEEKVKLSELLKGLKKLQQSNKDTLPHVHSNVSIELNEEKNEMFVNMDLRKELLDINFKLDKTPESPKDDFSVKEIERNYASDSHTMEEKQLSCWNDSFYKKRLSEIENKLRSMRAVREVEENTGSKEELENVSCTTPTDV